jgi:hypothetical protein
MCVLFNYKTANSKQLFSDSSQRKNQQHLSMMGIVVRRLLEHFSQYPIKTRFSAEIEERDNGRIVDLDYPLIHIDTQPLTKGAFLNHHARDAAFYARKKDLRLHNACKPHQSQATRVPMMARENENFSFLFIYFFPFSIHLDSPLRSKISHMPVNFQHRKTKTFFSPALAV